MDLRRLAFSALTSTASSGFSVLHGACVQGEVAAVRAILHQFSPSRLDTAIALTIRVGDNGSIYAGNTPQGKV